MAMILAGRNNHSRFLQLTDYIMLRVRPTPLKLAIFLVSPALFAIIYAIGTYTNRFVWNPHKVSNDSPIVWELIGWYLWALLVPFIMILTRTFRLEKRIWWRSLIIYIPTAFLVSVFHIHVQGLLYSLVTPLDDLQVFFKSLIVSRVLFRFFLFFIILSGCQALYSYRRFLEKALSASQAEAQLVRARLEGMKASLEPRFLFHTLRLASSLIVSNYENAVKLIARFGDLLRLLLQNIGARSSSFQSEFELIRAYLDLNGYQFGDRLKVQLNVDPETLDFMLPSRTLFSWIEKMIHPTVEKGLGSVEIKIDSKRVRYGARVELRFQFFEIDSGKLKELLDSTRHRLLQFFGNTKSFQLTTRLDDDCLVCLKIRSHQTSLHQGNAALAQTDSFVTHGFEDVNGIFGRLSTWISLAAALWIISGLYLWIIFYSTTQIFRSQNIITTNTRWYLWVIVAPGIIWMARRFPVSPYKLQTLFLHLAFSLLIGYLFRIFHIMFVIPQKIAGGFSQLLLIAAGCRALLFDWMSYWAIIAFVEIIKYRRRAFEEELRSVQIKSELDKAQIEALKMQLQPHFLFNTLNSIAGLIHLDPPAAIRMIEKLQDFLQKTIHNAGTQKITVEKELEFVGSYLAIQEIRFQDRLSVGIAMDSDSREALVPNLILQPIIENAIQHGISKMIQGGRIEIEVGRREQMLQIEVRDNGPGLSSNKRNEGLGLGNTRSRLQSIYGMEHQMLIKNRSDRGTAVILKIPFQLSEPLPYRSGISTATALAYSIPK